MIHRGVEGQLRRLGLTGCYQGYLCLVYGALLVYGDPGLLEMPTKLLYPEVARLVQIQRSGVDQAIRTAIQVCVRRNPEGVAHMCGTDGLPSIPQFLLALAPYCGDNLR